MLGRENRLSEASGRLEALTREYELVVEALKGLRSNA
jgi:hypothetical protein